MTNGHHHTVTIIRHDFYAVGDCYCYGQTDRQTVFHIKSSESGYAGHYIVPLCTGSFSRL
jgi:hypothetical protein